VKKIIDFYFLFFHSNEQNTKTKTKTKVNYKIFAIEKNGNEND